MRRLVVRILIVFLAVVLLAALFVQCVLWTDVPRDLVLRALEAQLRLRAQTQTLSTGWFGHTTLRGVRFSLPLADHPLLTVDELDVRHAWLLPLLFGGDLDISRLEFHKPAVRIVRNGDGRWNVEQLSAALNAGKSASTNGSGPALPVVDLIDGTVDVIDGSRQAKISGLNFTGAPDGALTWKFALSLEDRLKLEGRLVPGGTWEHQATLTLGDISPWARPWVVLPADLAAQATWHGRLAGGGVRGRLDASSLRADGWSGSGGLDVAQQDEAIDIHPDRFEVATPLGAVKSFMALSGDIRYQKNLLRAQSLEISVYGGPATITGYYDLAARETQLNASWDKLALPGGILHGGNLTLSVHRPFPTQIVAQGTLFSYASTPQGPWKATLNFGGQGDGESDFAWHLNASTLAWYRRTPIRLDGLELLGTIHHNAGTAPTIALASAQLPGSQGTVGNGFYNFANRSWALKLAGSRFPLQVLQNTAIGFQLDARGNTSLISLENFSLTQAQTSLAIKGSYRYGIPKPVNVTVSLTSPPQEQSLPDQQPILQGSLRGTTLVEGTLLPTQLDIRGQLFGRDVRVAGRQLGDISLRLTGEVTPDHARIETERLRALGGEWSLRATYGFAEELLDADLKVGGVPLENIGTAANAKIVTGTLAGEWDAYVLSFPINPRTIRLQGQGWIHGLSCRGVGADDVHFTTVMEDGVLVVDPIAFACGTDGKGTGTLQWNVAQPKHLEGSLQFTDWPIARTVAEAVVQLEVPSFTIDLPAQPFGTTPGTPLSIDADSITAQIALRSKTEEIGSVALSGSINGQVAALDDLRGTLLGAPVQGSVKADLAHPLESHGELSFEHLDAERIVKQFPAATGLKGMLRGVASLGPSTAEHPLEPLALHLQTNFDHGQFRGMPIGVFNLNAFMNTDRVVLDDRPGHDSTLQLASGGIRLWGRLGQPAPDITSSQVELHLDHLDLNQITRALNPKAKPTPGLIGGNIMLLYNSRADSPATLPEFPTTSRASPAIRKLIETIYGEARLTIAKSDIATVPIFTQLYDLMSLGSAGSGPIGFGAVEARLENGTLYASNLQYFNRGTDAVVRLTSPEIWNFPDNPIEGTAIGSLRPLAALKLPLVSDIQATLDAAAGNFRELRISGSWRKVKTTPIAFVEIGKEMRDLLIGDISTSGSNTGGQ